MACLGLGGRWDPELGFGAVVRLRGHRLEGACSGGAPGEPGRGAGCRLPPGREQCGLYPPSRPARRASRNMAPGAAPPVHGEGWRPDQPGPPRPPRAGLAVARRRGRPLPPPLGRPRPPPAGDGFGGPAHPPLPRLPPSQHPRASFKNSRWAGPSRSGRLWPPLPGSQCQRRAGDKSSIFLALLGWRRGLPSALGSWPACLRVAGVAEAAATPAGTEGTGGRRWPQPRRPRAGARAGPPLPAAGPGWGDGRRLHCLAVDQLSVLLRPVSLPPLQSSPRWRRAGGSPSCACYVCFSLIGYPKFKILFQIPTPPHPHHLQ